MPSAKSYTYIRYRNQPWCCRGSETFKIEMDAPRGVSMACSHVREEGQQTVDYLRSKGVEVELVEGRCPSYYADLEPMVQTATVTTPPVDYRSLLKKYIAHVGECEGVDFLGRAAEMSQLFTVEELTELRKVSEELMS